MTVKEILRNKATIENKILIREFVAEFMGTFTLLTIGNSVIAANILKGKDPEPLVVCFAYGVGAMIAILGCGHISGAHINPAGTLAQAVLNKFPWRKVWYYMIAQYLAGFVSSAVIYIVYFDAFTAYKSEALTAEEIKLKLASVFATFPFEITSLRGVLIDQIIGTAMLFFSISAIGNSKGFIVPKFAQAPITCILITGCCLAFGLNAGAIFNPARDLSPRLFALCLYGPTVFAPLDYHYWWAAGVVGPHLGGILGTYIYMVSCDCYSEEQEREQKIESYTVEDVPRRVPQNESTVSIC